MRDKHLKVWLAVSKQKMREVADKCEGKTDDKEGGPTEPHWGVLVDLIQTKFMEVNLVEEATWQAVVLIPKGKNYYLVIGLVEVMWKVVAAI